MSMVSGSVLSERELACLILLASGMKTAEVADRMSLARVTIDKYIKSIKIKLGARTMAQAIALAIFNGIIEQQHLVAASPATA